MFKCLSEFPDAVVKITAITHVLIEVMCKKHESIANKRTPGEQETISYR